jgi:uncharacterized protein
VRLPAGHSLQATIPRELFVAVQRRCGELALRIEDADACQPWAVALELSNATLARAGWRHTGVDRTLFERASQQSKSVEYLESAQEAFKGLAEAPLEEQITFLGFAVDSSSTISIAQGLQAAWKQRRGDLIRSQLRERIALTPRMHEGVVYTRNRLWLPRILDYLRDGKPTLVVVGVLHTLWGAGLPALIRAEGYDVDPVDVAAE